MSKEELINACEWAYKELNKDVKYRNRELIPCPPKPRTVMQGQLKLGDFIKIIKG